MQRRSCLTLFVANSTFCGSQDMHLVKSEIERSNSDGKYIKIEAMLKTAFLTWMRHVAAQNKHQFSALS